LSAFGERSAAIDTGFPYPLSPSAMTLDPGEPAPSIAAPNQDGEEVEPSFEAPTVLYFYPRDSTPGCTTEATEFAAEHESYREARVRVYGVSTDDFPSHREFATAEDLPFDLLADPDGSIAEAFGVPHQSGVAERTTFVIRSGDIERVYEGVDPDGHARTVLADMLDRDVVSLD
jgi:peroxiredoxin Q/BCP